MMCIFTEQLQEPEKEEKETVNFVVMLRKGNKQQYKNVAVPTDSELALNLRSQEKVTSFFGFIIVRSMHSKLNKSDIGYSDGQCVLPYLITLQMFTIQV